MTKVTDITQVVERDSNNPYMAINKPICFEDGYFLSVQASDTAYSEPRIVTTIDQYESFEVLASCPSDLIPDEWEEYHDGDDIYGYVPKEMVLELINKLAGVFGFSHN